MARGNKICTHEHKHEHIISHMYAHQCICGTPVRYTAIKYVRKMCKKKNNNFGANNVERRLAPAVISSKNMAAPTYTELILVIYQQTSASSCNLSFKHSTRHSSQLMQLPWLFAFAFAFVVVLPLLFWKIEYFRTFIMLQRSKWWRGGVIVKWRGLK